MDEKVLKYLIGGERFTELKRDDKVIYRFDRLFFAGFVVLSLLFFVLIFLIYGSDRSYHIHYVCNTSMQNVPGYSPQPFCENPFYLNHPVCESMWDGACDQKTVMNGFEFGDPAPSVVKYFGLILGVLLALTFLINHLVHNRGFKFPEVDL